VATARVHVIVSDRSFRKIGDGAFCYCSNLVKVTAPFVEEVGEGAFCWSFNLRHVTFSPDVVVKLRAFWFCVSLEVLATSVGFDYDAGDKDIYGRNDSSIGITRFAECYNQMDDAKEC
jgi:hypothetical protein